MLQPLSQMSTSAKRDQLQQLDAWICGKLIIIYDHLLDK